MLTAKGFLFCFSSMYVYVSSESKRTLGEFEYVESSMYKCQKIKISYASQNIAIQQQYPYKFL